MKFRVQLYFSSYIETEIEAEDASGAVIKAREQLKKANFRSEKELDKQILDNIEPWKDADRAERVL